MEWIKGIVISFIMVFFIWWVSLGGGSFLIYAAGGICCLGIALGTIFIIGNNEKDTANSPPAYSPEIMESARKSLKKTGVLLLVLCGIGFAAVLVWQKLYTSPENVAARKAAQSAAMCEDKGMAYAMAQKLVKRQLRSPSTAKFPYSESVYQYMGECRHSITGAVDSQNAFGATVRSMYSITVIYMMDEGRWRAEDLAIQ